MTSRCVRILETREGIVAEPEVGRLLDGIALAQAGRAFVLHAGDCAEGFASAERRSVEARQRVLWQMGVLLERRLGLPIIKVGRMAGQYAKPRSEDFELVQGTRLPVFRGEIINGGGPTHWEREHRPERLLWAYRAALHTVHLMNDAIALGSIRASLQSEGRAGQAALEHPLFAEIAMALADAEGPGPGAVVGHEFFVSHEALLLLYERALTRNVPGAVHAINGGAHLLWLGERTRQLDGPHALYLASIANPIGVKLGPSATAHEVRDLVRMLNPGARPGRLILIPRLGTD
ncbi:3-deoxy-7-phosphoheptulonate synthase, partial [Corallococcus sp. bb12-1]|uniref:3-deoxy-7-phosphoheptulonate synthase n=1 Tax=Corallococcus sp. bb12-1 TaxID=2996784 RepID=UPI00226D53E4